MTLARDLAWQNLELQYRSSIAYQYARYALGLKYEMLPPEVVHQAKRCVLDALGCALGAFDAPGLPICEETIREIGGAPEATVFGSGYRTSAMNATLVNSFLVRFLDYNDVGGGGHNSDSISALIAVSEKEKSSGRDFLTSLVISYEIGGRLRDSIPDGALEDGGWTSDIRGGLNMPPALGRLMGMTEEQIANAIGVCASRSLPIGILDAHREENFMAKNLRFGWITYDSILACLLAKRGFTGPARVVEGDAGLNRVVFKSQMDLERLTDFSGWRILKTSHKSLCANANTIAHIAATIGIVKENDLKPEDIASVKLKVAVRESKHTTTSSKKYARNPESADHSAFYGNAIAIVDRAFGPDQFQPQKYTDPVVLDLIEKITVEPDLTIPERSYQGTSEITTVDGRHFEKCVKIPHGFGADPMSDAELEDKFKDMASRVMSASRAKRLIGTIWDLDRARDLNETVKQMVFQPRQRR